MHRCACHRKIKLQSKACSALSSGLLIHIDLLMNINQTVRRNLERFPDDFMFQLTEIEWNFLKSQIVTSKMGSGGKQKLPFVFTEYGVLISNPSRRPNSRMKVSDIFRAWFWAIKGRNRQRKRFAFILID